MKDSAIQISTMGSEHLEEVVRIHLISFSGFFLTFLGQKFLYLLYGEILQFPGHVAYVAMTSKGQLIGFIVGVTDQTGFYGKLIATRLFSFAWAAKSAFFRKPSIISRLFRALTYKSKSTSASASGLLMSIGVLPEMAGSGAGRMLVRSFLSAMKESRVASVCLTTDKNDNDKVNFFYQSLGFTVAKEYVTPEGRWMNEYFLDLTTWNESMIGKR